VQGEQVGVHPDHRLAVPRVHPDLVVADAARQPQPGDRAAGRAHVDAQLPPQVQPRLALFVPGVGQQRLAVPFLKHQADIDVLLEAADQELLAVGGHQHADRRQRAAESVRADLGIVDPEHAAVGEHGHHKLKQPAAYIPPL